MMVLIDLFMSVGLMFRDGYIVNVINISIVPNGSLCINPSKILKKQSDFLIWD